MNLLANESLRKGLLLLFAIAGGLALGLGLGLNLKPVKPKVKVIPPPTSMPSSAPTSNPSPNPSPYANHTNYTTSPNAFPSESPSITPVNNVTSSPPVLKTTATPSINESPSPSNKVTTNNPSQFPTILPSPNNKILDVPSLLPAQTTSNTALNNPSNVPSNVASTMPSTSTSITPTLLPTNNVIEATSSTTLPSSPSLPSLPLPALARDDILLILSSVSNLNKLEEANTYQNKALNWMIDTFTFSSDYDEYQMKQKYILAALYFANGGDEWTHKNNFLSDDHECKWKGTDTGILKGVTECDDNLHITKLSLDSVGMTGTLPSEIGFLTSLTFLTLRENILEGRLPTETLRFMKSLQAVRFNGNFFTGNVDSLCEAWKDNVQIFYVDRDQVSCPCCNCCPFDA